MSILFVLLFFGGLAGLLASLLLKDRGLSQAALRELRTMPVTPLAAAQDGRVKLSGVARGSQTEASVVGQVPCIAIRRVNVSENANVVRTTTYERAFPFELDDGSGKLLVDPTGAKLDLEPLSTLGQTSSLEERCLRDGDTVVVIGDIVTSRGGGGGAPEIRFVTPPLISWRSIPETISGYRPPLGRIVSALALLGGLAGVIHTLVTGEAQDREVLFGFGGICAALCVVLAIKLKRAEGDD
jgi:hypothetical protein